MKTMFLTLVPFLLLPLAQAAQAEPISSRPVAVTAAGLDLTTPKGAAAMLQRIRDAAERGCREEARWDRYSVDNRRCRSETTAAFVVKLDAPLVTAYHAGRDRPANAQMIAAIGR